jgi:FkbM family methyltransferase
MHLEYLQIGAHIGDTSNDHIFNKITSETPALLIEPVPFLFEQLEKNYIAKFMQESTPEYNTILLNAAVSNYDGVLKLYAPAKGNNYKELPFWISQIASTNPAHIAEHLRVAEIEPALVQIDEMHINCYRLNTLIAKYGITSVRELHIDTEGHDYEILMDFDLSIIKPAKIVFENKHMDGIFVKGARYEALLAHFGAHGYKVVEENVEDTTMVLYK